MEKLVYLIESGLKENVIEDDIEYYEKEIEKLKKRIEELKNELGEKLEEIKKLNKSKSEKEIEILNKLATDRVFKVLKATDLEKLKEQFKN